MCRDCTDGARKAIVSMVYNVVIRSPTVSSCRTYLRSHTETVLVVLPGFRHRPPERPEIYAVCM